MIKSYWPEELIVMRSEKYYLSAYIYSCWLFISYTIFFIIGLIVLNEKYQLKKNEFSNLTSYSFYFILIGYLILFYSLEIKDIIRAESRFFSKYNYLINISSVIFLFTFIINLIISKKNKFNKLWILLSLIGFLIYPVAHSSRAVAVPFIIISLYNLFYNSNWKKFIVYGYLSFIFLGSSLYTRNELGLLNFLINLLYLAINPIIIIENLMWIMPGIGSTSLAMEMMAENWQFSGGLKNFLLYISPLPSIILSDDFWKLGYSEYLNVTYMGLNVDYISEWIWWFGYYGFIVGGFFSALVSLSPLILCNFFVLTKNQFILIGIFSIYFFMAGTSMSLRSSSRYLIYVIIIIFLSNFLIHFFKNEKK